VLPKNLSKKDKNVFVDDRLRLQVLMTDEAFKTMNSPINN